MAEHGRHRAGRETRSPTGVVEGTAIVEAREVDKTFGTGEAAVHALRGVSLVVAPGQLVVVKGRSGSGKTTLLNCLGGLETPDAGTVLVDGTDLASASAAGLVELRRHRIGTPTFSAADRIGSSPNDWNT